MAATPVSDIGKAGIELRAADSAHLIDLARTVMREYAELTRSIGRWRSAEADIAALPAPYTGPGSMLLIAANATEQQSPTDETMLGCAAILPLDEPGVAELQRIYVRPAARRRGVAEAMIAALTMHSVSHGRDCIRLATARELEAAQALYARLGFTPIPRYRAGLRSDALCFERRHAQTLCHSPRC